MAQRVFCTRCNAHTQQAPIWEGPAPGGLKFECRRCGIFNTGEEPYLPCPDCGYLTRPDDGLHHPACAQAK